MQTTDQVLLEGLVLVHPEVFEDARGSFFETYQAERYKAVGIHARFVQDNEAVSQRGVLRGLHYQLAPMAQGKLVRVVRGSVFDVAVDLRETSPTFGAWYGMVLSGENKKQLFIPHGFAHGYLVLEDDTVFCYKCDNVYSRDHQGGLRYDDPSIGIQWPHIDCNFIMSDKDLALPALGDHRR